MDKQYQLGLESLKLQKINATKWMKRQKLRLEAQAIEMQNEKTYVSNILENEISDLQEIIKLCKNLNK